MFCARTQALLRKRRNGTTEIGKGQRAVILNRTPETTVALAVHECLRAHQVWSASCVFQDLDPYATAARLKITAVCP